MAIIELMICTSKPRPINRPMVQMTLAIATSKGATMIEKRRKKNISSRKMANIASGAEVAICTSISTPKVSSATGSPVTWT